jgi:tetratricopeptide (TPR) repeat protein/CHAT domain-containing protein
VIRKLPEVEDAMIDRDKWVSIMKLAEAHSEKGEYDTGVIKLEAALELAENLSQIDLALTLNNLAMLYEAQGQYSEAELLHQRALKINEKQLGSKHLDVADTLNNLAGIYFLLGKYEEAVPIYVRAIAIRGNQLGENHQWVATSLNGLAEVYQFQGKYQEALPLYLRALAIRESENSLYVPTTLHGLARIYQSQGLYAEAEPLFKRALAIGEKQLGANHPNVANYLSNLALLYTSQGRYAEAEPLFKRALMIDEKQLGSNHPNVAANLNNLASLYESQQRYVEIEEIYLRALNIQISSLGNTHPDVAKCLNNLALLYTSQGRYTEVEEIYLRAADIIAYKMGEDHPIMATILNNLGQLYIKLEQYIKAEHVYLSALRINRQNLSTDHPYVAANLNGLAAIYQSQGKYSEAESYYLRALAISKQNLDADHRSEVASLNGLAVLYQSQGKYSETIEFYKLLITCQYNYLRHQFIHIIEHDHKLYLKSIKLTLELLLSLINTHLKHDRTAIDIALQAILLTKALSATAITTRNALLYSDRYAHIQPQLQFIRNLTIQFNSIDYDNPARVNILSQIREIEIEIAKAVPEMMLPDSFTIDRKAIALKLPSESTLIEFIRFNHYDFDNKSWKEARYLAFILPKDQPDAIQMIDLGNAEEIDDLVKTCREAIVQNFDENNKAGSTLPTEPAPADLPPRPIPVLLKATATAELYEKLIAPLQAHLHSQKLVIAPDGNLCHLPFNILLPKAIVSYLTTGRDLVRSQSSKPSSRSLVIADPDFDNTAVNHTPAPPIPSQQPQTSSAKNLIFKPLPNFGTLGRSIARKLNAHGHYQTSASKDAIVSGSCPHILSILTHGFALPETETETDPMARSGLAFSGANLNKNNLLLANEVATLDLHSNDLTILVACETALGDIKHGEGVYGLRRAFTLAGAKTLIATLWSIPVLASVVLVERFFDNLQIRKMEKGVALIEAQTYLRTRTQADLNESRSGMDALAELEKANYDLAGVDCPFAHPYFWAAWVCQGETG